MGEWQVGWRVSHRWGREEREVGRGKGRRGEGRRKAEEGGGRRSRRRGKKEKI